MKQGTFAVLLAYLDGAEEFRAPTATEELTARQHALIEAAATRRSHSYALVVRRNWRVEVASRRAFPGEHLPAALGELWKMQEGDAVDRLIGYEDGGRWVPGLGAEVGLTQAESMALRYFKLELRPMADICRWLDVQPRTVYNHAWEARQKLRRLFAGWPAVAAG